MPSPFNHLRPLAAPLALLGMLSLAAFAPTPAQCMEPTSSADQTASGTAANDHDEHGMHDHDPDDHAAHDQGVEGHLGQAPAASSGESDPHAHHRAMMGQTGYQRSEHVYELPDVELMGMDGKPTTLLAEIDVGKPIMVNFIFTTCTTICPVMSGIFSQVQRELGPEAEKVRMISVSIDPEYDTPERLRDYAARYRASPEWRFLTGDPAKIVAVQRAFDVYRGNKMNHEPTTLLRRSEGEPWVRLDGIASATEVAGEYYRLADR